MSMPDALGRFGEYGGRFVAETLMPNLLELDAAWRSAREDATFNRELSDALEKLVPGEP